MKKLKYAWLIVRNLVMLLVVFGAFAVANTGFETIVVAGLILIILNLDGMFRIWLMSRREDKTPNKDDKEVFDQYIALKEEVEGKELISSIFSYIAYLVTIFVLIVTALK